MTDKDRSLPPRRRRASLNAREPASDTPGTMDVQGPYRAQAATARLDAVAAWPPIVRLLGLVVFLVLGGCAHATPPRPETLPVYVARAEAGPLRAGAAFADITPEEPVWMGGFGFLRRSRGVHDPLFARALVLERGELRLALVALDVVGLQRQDVLRWRERIEAEGFDPRHVVIASTHNHGGPDTIGLWGFPPFYRGRSARYMERLRAGVFDALAQAREALRPAELAAAGLVVEPAGLMKNLRRPGVLDRELVVLHVRGRGGGPTIGTLIELGCHPEVLGSDNHLITADFPAWAVGRVEEVLGGVAIYVSGALGGLVTPDVEGRLDEASGGSWREAERVGRRVGDLAVSVVEGLSNHLGSPALAVGHSPLYLRNRNFRYDLVRWTRIVDREVVEGGYFLTEVNLWEVGPLRIATVPGEITPDLGIRIKQLVAGRPTLLVGLANDELGYFMPAADFELPIYSYERTLSPGPEGGERIVARLGEVLARMDGAAEDRNGSGSAEATGSPAQDRSNTRSSKSAP